MKTLTAIFLLTTICFAQNKLLKDIGDLKANSEIKNYLVQLSEGKPIIDNLADSRLKVKPFSLKNTIKLRDINFEQNPDPSRKFNFSKYDTNRRGLTKMTESIASRFGKGEILLPDVKKMSGTKSTIQDEVIELLFENK